VGVSPGRGRAALPATTAAPAFIHSFTAMINVRGKTIQVIWAVIVGI